ncbi:ATP-binding protein [Amycolatopsis sp. lyj-109]|uniref:ATP-binding protein n=1 Tax=Amycolatopsis sp. lyj-109 TaxID=2789287 RepID=UPI00397AF491
MPKRPGRNQVRLSEGLAKAVGVLGGVRAAEAASGIGKSTWDDAQKGRALPNPATTWPVMRVVLMKIPVTVTGVRDWDELYEAACAEAGVRARRTAPTGGPPGASPARGGQVPQLLPPGVGAFTARSGELTRLDELLLGEGSSSVRMVVVTGEPGIGKTALAVTWAWRHVGEFDGGVLYQDLRGWGPDEPASAEEVLTNWLNQLGLDTSAMPDDLASRSSALRSTLAGRRVLVLLDNAKDEEQVRPLLPGTPLCPVVITSRETLSGLVIHYDATVVKLDLLTTAESVHLLRELAGPRVDEETTAAERLVDLCGRLPLALRVVAANARVRTEASLASLVEELVDEHDRLEELDGPDPRSAPRGVFSWSYRRLPADVAAVFRAVGLFPGRTFDANTIAALSALTPRTAARHLQTLARVHLARQVAGRFEMHDLIRLYAAELANDDGDTHDARQRVFDYFVHTARFADELLEPQRYRVPLSGAAPVPPPFDDYEGAFAWFHAEAANAVALCRLDDPRLDTARWLLASFFRGFFFLTKRTHEWIETHRLALAGTIRSGDRKGEAITRSYLGVALHERGDDEAALAQYEIANRLFHEVGDEHGASNTLAQQAVAHRRRGEFDQALRLTTKALAFYRKAGSARNVAITIRSLGWIELELGHLADAERHLTESLTLCRQLGRGMVMDIARAHNALGQVLLRQGRYCDAEQSHRSAMEASSSCGSRFEGALALDGLGKVARATGDHTAADAFFQEAVTLLDEIGSPLASELRADLRAFRAGDRRR